jgi:hypothetical protein
MAAEAERRFIEGETRWTGSHEVDEHGRREFDQATRFGKQGMPSPMSRGDCLAQV